GPLAPTSRPRRKMTPRSYSATTRIKNGNRKMKKKPLRPRRMTRTTRAGAPVGYSSGGMSGRRPAGGVGGGGVGEVMALPLSPPVGGSLQPRLYANGRQSQQSHGQDGLSSVRRGRRRTLRPPR